MLKIVFTNETGIVLDEFVVERDLNGETDPIRLADSVKDAIEMKFEVPNNF
ncbi:hypothetical protein LCGC14_1039300 [marine sediment metagenome]|uniref:Uncharacterized protein n=1 Tax=marine sediment metagenome TaxID=412755 RepID=A0A0F9NDY1_9ZZZZ